MGEREGCDRLPAESSRGRDEAAAGSGAAGAGGASVVWVSGLSVPCLQLLPPASFPGPCGAVTLRLPAA